jgi:hypothetical protein
MGSSIPFPTPSSLSLYFKSKTTQKSQRKMKAMSRQQSSMDQSQVLHVKYLVHSSLYFSIPNRCERVLVFLQRTRNSVTKFPVFLRLNTQQIQRNFDQVLSLKIHPLETLRGASC